MIGKFQLQLGANEIISGMASSDYAPDGALSVSTDRVNPFLTPGAMYSMASAVNKSTGLTGNPIASSEDSQVVNPYNRIIVDSTGAVYSVASSGTLTKQITAGADTYSTGITDIVPFAGYNYISSTAHLVQINTSAWTRTEAYKIFNDTQALHPLLVYSVTGLLYFGDGNLLKKMDSTGVVTTAITLVTTEKIVALGIDPFTGLLLVSTQVSYNPTDTIQQRGLIYLYDGVSAEFAKKIIVEDMVCAFYAVGGTVYVGMGQVLGYWNGTGVVFLRRLTNVNLLAGDLPYKHHFANIRNILCVINGTKVIAYGEVVAGKKGFFNVAGQDNGNSNLGMICNIGNNQLGVGSPTNNFYVYDFSSTAVGTGSLTSAYTFFPRPVYIRRMRVITTGVASQGASTNVIQINIFDETGAGLPIAAGNRILPVASGTKYVFDFDFTGAKCNAIQSLWNLGNINYGLLRIHIYYDIAE